MKTYCNIYTAINLLYNYYFSALRKFLSNLDEELLTESDKISMHYNKI